MTNHPITLLTEKEAAEIINTSVSFLAKNRCYSRGDDLIPYLSLSKRCIRYQLKDLLAWIESKKVTSSQEESDYGF
ncbi:MULTISPECIES: helix-turn-helix transcriptional regulator [Vibrio]|uniref:Helix-turn-helix domain-containing protein n=1 Tax=Vibrio scophthalmi TaxID=45658 RepID=A0A1E3WRK0_9VIBR|nr:hypothetical protein [Vibrio scophthalmi]EJI1280443.1 hypothetical protein [Vibrio vulnificus]ODS12400.1 hypothetical protein VSF3289_02704 [Vibrio scophthalmi]